MSDSVDALEVREIDCFAVLAERYAADWRRIVAESPAATVFQSWEWTEAWWRFHGRGKRLHALIFSENGQAVGFAPFFGTKAPSPLRTWRLLGTGDSDYLDLIAAPGREQDVCDACVRWLAGHCGRWDWLDLQQIRPDAIAEGLLTAAARPSPVRVAAWEGETCPFLPLASGGPLGDWEAVRKGFGKKLRSNIGYYGRALDKEFATEYRVADETTLDDDLEAFFFLHQKRWNQRWLPGAFASRKARGFHQSVARALLNAGMLRLHTLALDGEIEAAIYCFQKGDRCCYYLGGFEPSRARWSIGTVLTARAIQHAVEADGAAEFDFLRGDEPYKYRWGARDRHNRRFSVTKRWDPRSGLLALAGKTSLAAEMRLKSAMHARHGGGHRKGSGKADGANG